MVQTLRVICKGTQLPRESAMSLEDKRKRAGGELFLSTAQVAARYGISRTTVWRWLNSGCLPKPMALSESCKRWKLSALESFEQESAL